MNKVTYQTMFKNKKFETFCVFLGTSDLNLYAYRKVGSPVIRHCTFAEALKLSLVGAI